MRIVGELLVDKKDSILENIVFKSTSYNRNYDFGMKYDSYVTTTQGYINYIRTDIHKPTMPIGEYMYNVFNIKLAKKCGVNYMTLLNEWSETNEVYIDFLNLIKLKSVDLTKYNKVVYISSLILNDKFRNKGICKEFLTNISKEFYGENVLILFLVKPFQTIKDDYEYFVNERTIEIKTYQKSDEFTEFEQNVKMVNPTSDNKILIYKIPALRYYNLESGIYLNDGEISEYKLYAHAINLALERINETKIFIVNPEKYF